ncbi:MAG: FAD-dependent oxidoreductase [Myxococcota bacterium]
MESTPAGRNATSRTEVPACVVVVGAGLAGLGAAWRLTRRGHRVIVLERRSWLGGRAAGELDRGFSIERGIAALTHADRHLVQLIGELGLSGSLLPLRLLQLAQAQGDRVAPIDPSTRRGAARIPGVSLLDGLRLVRLPRLVGRYRPLLDPDRPERGARWDDRSIADFAKLYFGSSSYERWIEPEAMSVYLSDAAETSRVAFLLGWIARGGGRARPGVPRAPLAEIVRAASEALDVRTRCRVERIEPTRSGYELHVRSGDRSERAFEADAVVLATAAPEAERLASSLIGPAERDHLRDVSYAPAVTLNVALERPLTGLPQWVRVPRVERSPVAAYLAEPGLGGGRAPDGCGVLTACGAEEFGLAHAGSPDEVVTKTLFDGLERFHPRLGGLVRFVHLSRSVGAIPHFQVGAYRALERFRRVQRDRRESGRRVYFAGDYLNGPRAEQALSSGLRAAVELDTDFRT